MIRRNVEVYDREAWKTSFFFFLLDQFNSSLGYIEVEIREEASLVANYSLSAMFYFVSVDAAATSRRPSLLLSLSLSLIEL